MGRKISKNGLNLIKKFEGCRLKAYQDSVGVWTIGYGTTNADKSITGVSIKKGLEITQEVADRWLEESVNKKYGPLVNRYDNIYKWSQNEFDALVSFAYNIGSIDQLTDKGKRSKKIISDKILLYNKAGGKVLQGLVNRRKAERDLFIKEDDDKVNITNSIKTYKRCLELQKAIIKDKLGKVKETGSIDEATKKVLKGICLKAKKVNNEYTIGSTGECVKLVQEIVGSKVDGKYGKGTRELVIKFQKANGLVADGICGYNTLIKMIKMDK